MARLYTVGFETQSASDGVEDPDIRFVNSPTIATATPRSGLAYASCGTSSTPRVGLHFAQAAGSTYYTRFCFRFDANPSTRVPLLYPWATGGGWYFVVLETDGNLAVYNMANGVDAFGTQLTSTSSFQGPLATGVWHDVLVVWTVQAAGNGSAIVTVDGTGILLGIGNVNAGTTAWTDLYYGKAVSDGTSTILLDDIAVNDGTGSNENGQPDRAGKIVLCKPTADFLRTGFTGGGGGTTNTFDAMNNYPPTGAASPGTNASQNGSANNNATDNIGPVCSSYGADLSASGGGIRDKDVILLVQAMARVGNSTTTSRNADVQGLNPTLAAVTQGTGTTAAAAEPTGWTTKKTAPAYLPSVGGATQPVVQVTKKTASTDNLMVDMMGMLVEYRPGPELITAPPRSPGRPRRVQ